MKTFEIEVRQTVKVNLDETKFDETFMEEFRTSFFPFYDIEDHAEHIAQLKARGVAEFSRFGSEFVEGYGPIKDFEITAEVVATDMEIVSE